MFWYFTCDAGDGVSALAMEDEANINYITHVQRKFAAERVYPLTLDEVLYMSTRFTSLQLTYSKHVGWAHPIWFQRRPSWCSR